MASAASISPRGTASTARIQIPSVRERPTISRHRYVGKSQAQVQRQNAVIKMTLPSKTNIDHNVQRIERCRGRYAFTLPGCNSLHFRYAHMQQRRAAAADFLEAARDRGRHVGGVADLFAIGAERLADLGEGDLGGELGFEFTRR